MASRILALAGLLALSLDAPGAGAQDSSDAAAPPSGESGAVASPAPGQTGAVRRVWDCISGNVAYEVNVPPDASEARVETRIGDNFNVPPIATYAIGAVAPFPRFDFADGNNRFYATSSGVLFVSAGEDPITCTERTLLPPDPGPDGRLDIAGLSLGAQPRSGPGPQYAALGALDPGTPLTIVAGTEIVMDDFLWWDVEIDGTRVFHWGGALCASEQDLVGLTGRCGEPVPELDAGAVLRSRGGNVRSGPGTRFDDIGAIPEGEAITAISNTGIVLDGEPWFEISFEDGTAYHWGGLLCIDGPAAGTGFPPC